MNALYFNIYDYRIEIKSADFPLKHLKINADFSFFSTLKNSDNQLQVTITELRPFTKKGFKVGSTRMCEVRQVGFRSRQLIYSNSGRALAIVSDTTSATGRKVEIQAINPEIIDDVLYFLVNACAGEFLDANGIMRVHAFSFLGDSGRIVYGASGAGKSTLALSILNNSALRIYSDEISLFDLRRKILLPYPIRISAADSGSANDGTAKFNIYFGKKTLFKIPDERIAPVAPVKALFILKPGETENASANWYDKLKLAFEISFGIGLIQMWEYFLRLDNFGVLFVIFYRRLKLAALLLKLNPLCLASRRPIPELTATIEHGIIL